LFSTITDVNGYYSFDGLSMGHYVIKENNPLHSSTADSDGLNDDLIAVSLIEGDSSTGHNFLDNNINQRPIADDDHYSVTQGSTLIITTSDGVLVNDADPYGGFLTSTLITHPEHGLVSMTDEGNFFYTPETGFTGIDTFTYQISDGNGGRDITTVTIVVNSQPVVVPQPIIPQPVIPQPVPQPVVHFEPLVPVEAFGQLDGELRFGFGQTGLYYAQTLHLGYRDVAIDSRLIRVLGFGNESDMPANQYIDPAVRDEMYRVYRDYNNGQLGDIIHYNVFNPLKQRINSIHAQLEHWYANGGETGYFSFHSVTTIDQYWLNWHNQDELEQDELECDEECPAITLGEELAQADQFESTITFGEELAQADLFEIERDRLLAQLACLPGAHKEIEAAA